MEEARIVIEQRFQGLSQGTVPCLAAL